MRTSWTAAPRFAVWAPGAQAVSVIGDWNGWKAGQSPFAFRERSAICAWLSNRRDCGALAFNSR